jgi:hypothetical protein
MVYVLVLLLSAVLVRGTREVRESNRAAFIVACGLATFVALRGSEVSNDFMEYQEWYRIGADAEGLLERPPLLEALFLSGMDLSSQIGLPFRWFLWAVALLAIALKFYSIRRVAVSGPALWAGACCYLFSDFLLHEFTQLRAGLAIACFMLALVFLGEQRYRAFFATICAGALIHSASLLGLLALPLARFRRGRLDALLLGLLAAAATARVAGLSVVEIIADTLGKLDARVALYAQFAASGVNEPVQPLSVRTVLVLLLILSSYVALISRARRNEPTTTSGTLAADRIAFLTLLRLIVLGQIALFVFADVKELAVRVMEFWMACLPLYAARLAQTRGMMLPRLLVWLWLAATFANYVFRDPALVAPYSLSL